MICVDRPRIEFFGLISSNLVIVKGFSPILYHLNTFSSIFREVFRFALVVSQFECPRIHGVREYIPYIKVGTKNRTSLDNPVILAVESFKVTSYKFRFSDETMFILPSYGFLLEFSGQLLQTNK